MANPEAANILIIKLALRKLSNHDCKQFLLCLRGSNDKAYIKASKNIDSSSYNSILMAQQLKGDKN